MLKIYDQYKNPLGYIAKYTDLCIESTLSTGDKELEFTYRASTKPKDIGAEYYIETKDDFFVVKEVSTDSNGYPEIVCTLDLEGLESDSFSEFTIDNGTLESAVSAALVGTGWTYSIDSGVASKKRTYTTSQWKTPYEILESVVEIWMCEMRFDTKNRIVYIAEELGEDRGVFFESSLNLKRIKLTSDTNDYYTRIIPIGEDELRITSVNNGLEYVENYQYSNKIRTLVWENTNYTDAATLKEDAEKKLEEISKPVKSYSVELVDLAKQSEKYSLMEFGLGDTILLLNEATGIKEKQRIVKLKEYPQNPWKNTCELSSTVPSFLELTSEMRIATDTLSGITDSSGSVNGSSVKYIVQGTTVNGVTGIELIIEGSDALTRAIELSQEYTNTTLESYATTSYVDAAILAGDDEILAYVTQNYSTTSAVYTNISDAISEAESYTETRLESYTTTEDMTSIIDMRSDSILEYVSNTYATSSEVAETATAVLTDAQGYTETWVTTQLESYSTTTEMNSAIELAKDAINLSVSETYATTASVETSVTHAIETAEEYAETYTETKLESYSTTTEMNSAIDMAKDSINLSVSQTYATTSTVQTSISDVLSDAESYTDQKLESYSTTEEVVSMIELGAGTIDLSVYAKTTEVTGAIETCETYADGVASSAVTTAESYTETYVSASLVLEIKNGVGVLSGNADRIELTAGELVITSGGLILDESGNATFKGVVNATEMTALYGYYITADWGTSYTALYGSGVGGTSSELQVGAGFSNIALEKTTYVNGALYVNSGYGYLYCKYIQSLSGDLILNDDVDIEYDLVVDGTLDVYSMFEAHSQAYFDSLVDISGSLDVGGSLDVTGAASITSTLNVGGITNFWSSVGISGSLSVSSFVEASSFNESDRRLKTGLENLSVYDAFFDSLQTGRFQYTFDESGKYHMGMYAQDVEESLLACGLTTNDFAGLMTVNKTETSATYHGLDEEYLLNYTEFIPILIYQVQKSKSRISELETTVAYLQAAVVSLVDTVMQAQA